MAERIILKTFAIKTIGCKVNQYDSQLIRENLSVSGCVEAEDHPDIFIVSTCAVTHNSVAKSRQAVRRAIRLYPDAEVIVTGCCVESDYETFSAIPGVSILVKNKQKAGIGKLIGAEISDGVRSIKGFAGHSRAFIKIQDGCNFSCSYCIVPRVRGRSRSRPMDEILEEAKQLVSNGYREVVLSGIHLGAYGKDRGEPSALVDLIRLMERIEKLRRIRLSSIEPREVSDDLIEVMSTNGKLCPHIHIPLQSGDEGVLKVMKRNYTPGYYRWLIDKIRNRLPDISLTTDVMIGFPAENEEAFLNTVAMVEHCGFSRVHIFPFSPRPETEAWRMGDPISPAVKEERKEVMQDAAAKTAEAYRRRFLGRSVEVLVQWSCDGSRCCGITREYLTAYLEGENFITGRIYDCYVEDLSDESLKCRSGSEINVIHK